MKPPELYAVTSLAVPWQDSHIQHLSSQHCISSENEESFTLTAGAVTDCPYGQMSKESFIYTMGLWPKNRPAEVSWKRRNMEYYNIDWNEDTVIPPTLSSTTEWLVSNSSRNKDTSQGINSLISRIRRPLLSPFTNIKVKANSERAETIEENFKEINTAEEKVKILHAKSFYRLDLTSPLGQLVIRHLKGDPSLHVLSDAESHCLTSAPNNDTATIRLRERHTAYPITFKGFSGKFTSSHVHQYSFTRRQKTEFMCRVNTGLDKKSRTLFKKIKPCKVRLPHITKADLKRWMLSTNEVMVILKPLSLEEISYWTSPKINTNTNSVSVFTSKNVTALSPESAARVWNLLTNLNIPFFKGEQTFTEVTTNKSENLLSDFIINKNETSESENTALILPVPILTLNRCLLSQGSYIDSLRQIHILPDRTNFMVDSTHRSAIKCPVFCSPNKVNNTEDRTKACSFYSYKCMYCYRNTPVDSSISESTKCSDLCGWSSGVENKIGQLRNVPIRSGIYNVHICISEEGKIIKDLVHYFHTNSKNEHNESRNSMEWENTSLVMKEELKHCHTL